jgi:predicted metal-dependent hydrolase
VERVKGLIERDELGAYLLAKHPTPHEINTNKLLRAYVMAIKDSHLRSSPPLSKVCFDDKLHLVQHALGTHTFISRPQGGRLKAKRELRISSLFKRCPEPLLRMIVVHELAHLRDKEHSPAFYQLCVHMEPRYHQLEFEARLYLIYQELYGSLYPREQPQAEPSRESSRENSSESSRQR